MGALALIRDLVTQNPRELQAADGDLLLKQDPTTALGAATKQYVDARTNNPQDIAGLELVWNSATSVSCNAGWCYIPSLGHSIAVAAQTLTGIATAANSVMHYYISSTGILSASTTAPSSYSGTAYQKTGDNTNRYIGSTSSATANTIIRFMQRGNHMVFVAASPTVYNGTGMSTAWTTVTLASMNLPLTTTDLDLRINNYPNTVAQVEMSNPDTGFASPTAGFLIAFPLGGSGYFNLAVSAAGTFQYGAVSAGSGQCVIMLNGYNFSR
jgi:hypothetical protein